MTIQDIIDRIKLELNAIGTDFERINDIAINKTLNVSFRKFIEDAKRLIGVITKEKAYKILGGNLVNVVSNPTQIDLVKFIDLVERYTSSRVRSGENIIDKRIYNPYDAYYTITSTDGNILNISIIAGELVNVDLISFSTSDFASQKDYVVPDKTGEAIVYATCLELCKMPESGLEQYVQNYLNLYTKALADATRV
jgi:hypothetical protein